MQLEFNVDDREVLAALRALGRSVGSATIRRAVRAGATVIAARARQLAPVLTGRLRRSIKVRTRVRRGEGRGYVVAAAPHAHLVELGTRPHKIKRKVRHPGAKPHPFLRPAIDETANDALQRLAEVLAAAVASVTTTKGA